MLGVLALFTIPIGGGIPAGVLLARSRGLAWPLTAFLYMISDVMLACVFEPLMHGAIRLGRRSAGFSRFAEAMKLSMTRTALQYGVSPGPFTLILISFGIDPMTGRTATHLAGHGFVAGWTLTIIGDMMYYGVIAYTTLKVNSWLGNANVTTVIIMLGMFLVPPLIRRARAALGLTSPSRPPTSS